MRAFFGLKCNKVTADWFSFLCITLQPFPFVLKFHLRYHINAMEIQSDLHHNCFYAWIHLILEFYSKSDHNFIDKFKIESYFTSNTPQLIIIYLMIITTTVFWLRSLILYSLLFILYKIVCLLLVRWFNEISLFRQ